MIRPTVQLHSSVVLNPSGPRPQPSYRPGNGFLLDTPVQRLPKAPARAYPTRPRNEGTRSNG